MCGELGSSIIEIQGNAQRSTESACGGTRAEEEEQEVIGRDDQEGRIALPAPSHCDIRATVDTTPELSDQISLMIARVHTYYRRYSLKMLLASSMEMAKPISSVPSLFSFQGERETESAHFRDDYQKLRGRLLQRIKDEVSLLDEGLQALRREPPKVHVMIDHAERAIEALQRETDRLRGEE